jgi:hypothetical protein
MLCDVIIPIYWAYTDMGTVPAEGGFFGREGVGFFVRQKKYRSDRGGFFEKIFSPLRGD